MMMMKSYKVEVWEIQSYYMTVEADDADKARTEATRILQESTPENCGAAYGDRWTDLMEAEAV